eukprot:2051312-Amphidinium_carterae.1
MDESDSDSNYPSVCQSARSRTRSPRRTVHSAIAASTERLQLQLALQLHLEERCAKHVQLADEEKRNRDKLK